MWVQDIGIAEPSAAPQGRIRQAVVIVHGMGSQRPLDMLTGFVDTAVPTVGGRRIYYSRPTQITDSYEARRFIAPQTRGNPPAQRQVELFEYHWSFMMTGNKCSDVLSSTARLLLRRPSAVPDGLFGIWWRLWITVALMLVAAVTIVAIACGRGWSPLALTAGAVGTVLLAVGGFTFGVVKNVISATFVDVVRYLDTSPRSYSARRAIRGGMVALLRELHDADYDRIVVVAHSLGGYIAYDALMSLWAENHQIHSGLPAGASETLPVPLAGLDELESAAAALMRSAASDPAADVAEATDPDCVEPDCRRACQHEARRGLVRDYQQRQFALWEGLRAQGNPWRVTDFVTVGTPMYFADILITQPPLRSGFRAPTRSTASAQPRKVTSRTLFDDMIRRGQLVTCPPRSETSIVEAINPAMPPSYRWTNGSRQILGSQSIFAVTRWTNLWFPTRRGHLAGDWFGGRLAPLFGPGVRDIRICGNRRWRFAWALAHSRYFDHPDEAKPADLAGALHAIFNFTGIHANLQRIADREQVTDPAPTQAAAGHSAHAAPPQPPADDAGQ